MTLPLPSQSIKHLKLQELGRLTLSQRYVISLGSGRAFLGSKLPEAKLAIAPSGFNAPTSEFISPLISADIAPVGGLNITLNLLTGANPPFLLMVAFKLSMLDIISSAIVIIPFNVGRLFFNSIVLFFFLG